MHCTYVYECAFKKQSSFNQRIFLSNQTVVPGRSTIRAETAKCNGYLGKLHALPESKCVFFYYGGRSLVNFTGAVCVLFMHDDAAVLFQRDVQ